MYYTKMEVIGKCAIPEGTMGDVKCGPVNCIFTESLTGQQWKLSPKECTDHLVVAEDKASSMNKSEYLQFHKECCDKMTAITLAKNADYTGTGDDPFANFKGVEQQGITDTYRGLLVRMSDKMSRLASFAQRGIYSVKDESVEDTLLDLANYCILTAGYLRSSKVCTNGSAESEATNNEGESNNGI